MIVDLQLGPGQQKRVTSASAVVVRNQFGDPVSVTLELNNAIVFAALGDSDFEQYLRAAGVKVSNTKVQQLYLP